MTRKDHCYGTQGSIPMSCASGPRGWRWRCWLTRRGPRARSVGSPRSWVSTPRLCAPGSRRPRSITDEAQRIKELEKGVRELRRANAILKSASACLSRRSVSARPADPPVHRDQEEGGVRGLADLQGAHWRRSQDRPEHLTHARRSRPPSARGLRDKDPQDRDQTSP